MWPFGKKAEQEEPEVVKEPQRTRESPREERIDERAHYEKQKYYYSSIYSSLLSTPVKFEDINRESKNIIGTMELFDGFRFEFNKTVSEKPPFGVSHAIGMGSVLEPANYNLGTNLIYNGLTLSGRVDTDGHVMGRVQKETESLVLRVSAQSSPEPHTSAAHVEMDYKGRNWYGNVKWGNPGIYGISFMQMLTPRLSVGLDTFYHHKQAMSLLTGGFRYETDESITTGILTTGHLMTSYTRKYGERVNFSTELTASWASGSIDTTYSVGADYLFRSSHIKAHVDTNWKVSCYLEEMLNQFTRFMVCAELDHKKKSYRFGFGVMMAL